MKRYIRHFSGLGKTYELKDDYEYEHGTVWRIKDEEANKLGVYFFPISEYVLCGAPIESWRRESGVHYIHLQSVYDKHGTRIDGDFRVPCAVEQKVKS